MHVYTILYSLYWYRVNINDAGKDVHSQTQKKGRRLKRVSHSKGGRGIRANKKDSTCSWFDAYGFTLNSAFVGHNYFPSLTRHTLWERGKPTPYPEVKKNWLYLISTSSGACACPPSQAPLVIPKKNVCSLPLAVSTLPNP